MNTFILFWNPFFSSMKIPRYLENLYNNFDLGYDWSVYDHEHAHKGDRFFMVMCGYEYHGICMSGHFISEPIEGQDWSGRGRQVFYMDMLPDIAIDPTNSPLLTPDELAEIIPQFKWTGGRSGQLLDPLYADRLEKLWKQWLQQHEPEFRLDSIPKRQKRH